MDLEDQGEITKPLTISQDLAIMMPNHFWELLKGHAPWDKDFKAKIKILRTLALGIMMDKWKSTTLEQKLEKQGEEMGEWKIRQVLELMLLLKAD